MTAKQKKLLIVAAVGFVGWQFYKSQTQNKNK